MISYKNYLTTPSGKECYLNSITNAQYLILLKFTAAKDYQGFYEALDTLIKETIPDFDQYNIIDKAYVYIANCLYSVHNTIVVDHTLLGEEIIGLSIVLNVIEKEYNELPQSVVVKLKDSYDIEITLPTDLLISHTNISLDYSTGVSKIKDFALSNTDDQKRFFSSIDPKLAVSIENIIKKNYRHECILFKNVSVNLVSEDIFHLIFQLYAEDLEDFYQLFYHYLEYLKWGYDTWSSFTPLESRIMFNFYKEDKEKQAKEREEQMRNNRYR